MEVLRSARFFCIVAWARGGGASIEPAARRVQGLWIRWKVWKNSAARAGEAGRSREVGRPSSAATRGAGP